MHMTISGRSTIRASIAAIALIGAGMASGAHAADLASRPYAKAPAMAVAAYDWSGFYIGANGGWGSSHHCWDAVMPNGTLVPDGCHDATGAVLGGQIGYRWQAGAWVFGLEAQGDWANLRGSSVSPTGGADVVTNESRVVGFGLFTGQIGFAVNNALLYVRGGAAVASNRYSATSISRPAFNEIASDRRWGGAVGAGLEYGFAPNWSVAVEYDRLILSDQTDPLISTLLQRPLGNERISQNVDLVTLRLNYRFGGR
jgi:outer membrane immunogenic protein